MATFLQLVASICLIIVWGLFVMALRSENEFTAYYSLLIAIGASIPAALLFAFARVVTDVRSMRDDVREARFHLAAIRQHYEPHEGGAL